MPPVPQAGRNGVFRTFPVVNGGAIRILNNGQGQVIFRGGGIVFQAAASDTPAEAPTQVPTLRWKNGETLPGGLVAASGNDLTWKSPLFDDPLQVQWNVIDRIDWPAATEQPKDPFGIALRDGSFVYGDIVAIGADTVTIRSTRHGDAVLKRSEVLSLRRLHSTKLVYDGPTGVLGWQAMTNQQDGSVIRNPYLPDATSPVVGGPGGALLIRTWNRSAFLDVTLPASVDVEFHLHSSKRPEFLIALGGSVHEPLRIETWDNVLVLACADQFKIIRRIQDNERDVALRVCYNSGQQQCSVYDPSGQLLTTWNSPVNPGKVPPGFVVQNRGLDLSLDLLRVRSWDGKAPAKLDPKQPRVEADDGRSASGNVTQVVSGPVSVQSPGGTTASFSPGEIDTIVFSPDLPTPTGHPSSLAFNDGTFLVGRIASITGGQASFVTGFTSQPLAVQMTSPLQLLNATAETTAEPPLDDQDKIVIHNTTLHGKLSSAGEGSLGWLPVGGVKPARPSGTLACEITRVPPKDAPAPPDPALFYLDSGDVVPGTLHSLDRTGAELESTLMNAMKLAPAQVDAIEFSPPTRLNVQSFSDAAWKVVKGDDSNVTRAGNTIQLSPETAISLPGLMQSGDFSFKYAGNGFSAARVRLFSAGKDDASSLNVLLCNSGGQFTSGLESTPGQFDNQFQVRTQPGTPVTVQFKVGANSVELLVNGVSAGQFPIDPAKCAGSGVIIEPASIWGNGVFTVSLTDFAAHSVVGRSWLPEVSSDIRNQVLTLPRFAKDDPPRHLLIASNGDVLRGEVGGATDSHFAFRCGMENLNVPRDRVRAVICLQPPSKNAPAAAGPAASDADVLADPLHAQLADTCDFKDAQLIGVINVLLSKVKGLKIEVPEEVSHHHIDSIRLAEGPVADVLTQICAKFDLHYRLDADNTIVLESQTAQAGSGMLSRTYWLKPDAIPAAGPAQDFLGSKGISFPKDTSVEWRPGSGVLTMVNTETNQGKLAALIASDLGGSLGSPTHWIDLASGGRLAVAVDKFGPDVIEAHHPLYGAIKLPMAQVYMIRTTEPEPTVSGRALQNWHLVNAPEPVIPEGNGENSPLLGKDAPAFTLPKLDGGDFDLASERGHVVVLDFWATWCGPCIKSLPGIVEMVSAFPADKVKLIGVNQGESAEQVKKFLAARGLKLDVLLDADQAIGRKYGIDAIPRTLIIGPDGKVAWDQTGYDADAETTASGVIKKLLDPSAPKTP